LGEKDWRTLVPCPNCPLKGKDLDAFMQEREFQATHGQNENTKEHILHLTVTI
jgi:hypothetical protein